MKLLLPFALFLAISVEGHLRGDHRPSEKMPRSLRGCKKKGKCMKNTLEIIATTISSTSSPAAPSPLTADVRALSTPVAVPRKAGFETCKQAAGFQNKVGVVPCFSQAACATYDPGFGEPCCLATKCICGSTKDRNYRCAKFAPSSVTVPIVPTVLPTP